MFVLECDLGDHIDARLNFFLDRNLLLNNKKFLANLWNLVYGINNNRKYRYYFPLNLNTFFCYCQNSPKENYCLLLQNY